MAEPTVTYEQLIAFAAGSLTGPDAAAVERYVNRNAEAAATVARFRLVQQRMAADDSLEPSADAIARAQRIFSQHATVEAQPERLGWLAMVDRFIARLIFDSRLTPLAARNAALDQRVTMTFALAQGEVDLQAEPIEHAGGDEPQTWRLIGQVTDAGVLREVALTKSGSTKAVAHAVADDHGGFELEGPAGRYDVHLRFEGRTAVISGVDLQ